jgi:hypothetical protein
MVEKQGFSDALTTLMVVLLLLMPFGNPLVLLAVFAFGLIPALVFYRHTLTRLDFIALAVAAGLAMVMAFALR